MNIPERTARYGPNPISARPLPQCAELPATALSPSGSAVPDEPASANSTILDVVGARYLDRFAAIARTG